MDLLDTILKASDRHAQAVILILVGSITAGSIAGGLWIHDLQTIVAGQEAALQEARVASARRDELEKQRITAIQEKFDVERQRVTTRFQDLELGTKRMKAYIERLDEVVAEHVALDTALAIRLGYKAPLASRIAQNDEPLSLATQLAASASRLQRDSSSAKEWVTWAATRNVETGSSPLTPMIVFSPPHPHAEQSWRRIVFVAAFGSVGIGLTTLALIRRRRLSRV